MKIFINGDSHTSGSELYYPKQDAYSYKLAELLSMEVVSNPAIGGASNDRILRTTLDYLKDCEANNSYPDFILIGWSESCRTDWFYDGDYKSTFSEEFSPNKTNEVNSFRANYHWDTYRQPEIRSALTKYFHERMYDLHLHLNHLKIPHLFFMGVYPLPTELDCPDFSLLPNFDNSIIEYDWNNRFWKVYDIEGSFLTWGRNQGYEVTKWSHLKEDAHEHFAQVLYKHILDNNLLKS